jgi:hypothetical protein
VSGRQFVLLLAADFRIGVSRNGLTYSAVLFPLHFPFRSFVPSRSNRALQFETELCSYVNAASRTHKSLGTNGSIPASAVMKLILGTVHRHSAG